MIESLETKQALNQIYMLLDDKWTEESIKEFLKNNYNSETISYVESIYKNELKKGIPSRKTLFQYLKQGFTLGILNEYTDKNGEKKPFQVKNCESQIKYDSHGVLKNFVSEHKIPTDTLIKIKNDKELDYWLENGYKRFFIVPSEKNFLCLDIDRGHSDGKDGLKNFYQWLKKIGHDDYSLFRDIENSSFPVYTESPSGGFHLYFKLLEPIDLKHNGDLAENVEVKYGKGYLTTGGSVKNCKPYKLHGNLSDAPIIPLFLLNYALQVKEKQKEQIVRNYENDLSIEKILNNARDNVRSTNTHDVLLTMATFLHRTKQDLSENDILGIIQDTIEYQNSSQKNIEEKTKTTIRWVFENCREEYKTSKEERRY